MFPLCTTIRRRLGYQYITDLPTARARFSPAPLRVAKPTDADRSLRAPEAGEVVWSSMLPSVWTQPRREDAVERFAGSTDLSSVIHDKCREVTNLE